MNGRHITFTEAVIYARSLIVNEKLVLAASTTGPKNDDSLSQMERTLPLNRNTISEARLSLAAKRIAKQRNIPGLWANCTKTILLDSRYALTDDTPYFATIPASLVAMIRAGGYKMAPTRLLMLALYARLQIRYGAAMAYDRAVANDLSLPIDTVNRARLKLEQDGLLIRVDSYRRAFIMVLHPDFRPAARLDDFQPWDVRWTTTRYSRSEEIPKEDYSEVHPEVWKEAENLVPF